MSMWNFVIWYGFDYRGKGFYENKRNATAVNGMEFIFHKL